jgi:hypothetical protein
VVGVLALLGTCGLFTSLLVQDELAGRNPQVAPTPTGPVPRDISSRQVDPEPLTEDEVFPTSTIYISVDEDPYQVLGTHDSPDCTVAAADALADLIAGLDCTQVVRGTIRSPTGDYLITAGIFNLATAEEAEQAYDAIDDLLDRGRFLGMMVPGEDTEAIVLSETRLGWDYRGHFLIYAVIARTDGGALGAQDERTADVLFWDMIEVHLRSGVLDDRATMPMEAAPGERRSEQPDQSD